MSLISIIIPTLERDLILKEQLRLLDTINSDQIEVVIIDDSSNNSNIDFEDFDFKITYLFRGKKLGVSSARNEGAKLAEGNYLIFLDDDDKFHQGWLSDFRDEIPENPDLVFCNMVRVEPNGEKFKVKISDSRNGAMGDRIVIPGAWMLKKSMFEKVGGYDERILFAENTEFFIRVFDQKPSVIYINKFNFIYHPCPTGGSKNLQNMVDSLTIILEKHKDTLSTHVKYLYHQIIGVNQVRFRNFSQARFHLWKAIEYKPLKVATWGRFALACFPFLAKQLYSETVKHD